MTKESLEEWGERMASIVETDEWHDKVIADIKSGRAKVITDPEEIERIRGRGRPSLDEGPSAQVRVRVGGPLLGALDERVARTHTSRSEVVREALVNYLNKESKQ